VGCWPTGVVGCWPTGVVGCWPAGVGGVMTEGIALLTIFIFSAFTGYEVISKVSTILHTPLMSGANAIHGVILIGAVLVAGRADTALELWVGLVAVFLATLNMVGGFVVTDRMLEMFRTQKRRTDVHG
jgi:H+-translocating NAD(P) transhydrogenase subunit alpha